jgi:DNA-binding protein HU-beta
MTKAELIERVAKDSGPTVSKKHVGELVELVFEHLYKAIRKDKRFTYPGFGTWSVKKRKARKGRNPKTGETIQIPVGRKVSFKPSFSLKKLVRLTSPAPVTPPPPVQ